MASKVEPTPSDLIPRRWYVSIRENERDGARVGMFEIAHSHFWAAELLRTAALRNSKRKQALTTHSPFAASAICLYHASLECWVNERLALGLLRQPLELRKVASKQFYQVQGKTLGRQKLNDFARLWKGKKGRKFRQKIIDDSVLFCEVRKELYHHNAEMRSIRDVPRGILPAFAKAGISLTMLRRVGWLQAAISVEMMEWSRSMFRAYIAEFARVTGTVDPFNNLKKNDFEIAGWDEDFNQLRDGLKL